MYRRSLFHIVPLYFINFKDCIKPRVNLRLSGQNFAGDGLNLSIRFNLTRQTEAKRAKFDIISPNLNQGEKMPFVNIKLAAPEPTKEQKKQIIAEVTDTLARVLGKDPAAVLVMIETLGMDSIGKSGLSLEEIRQNKEKK